MKHSKPCLPRKLKKAAGFLEMLLDTGEVCMTFKAKLRDYPRTKWVVRSERLFKRLYRDIQEKNKKIERLEAQLKALREIMKELPN